MILLENRGFLEKMVKFVKSDEGVLWKSAFTSRRGFNPNHPVIVQKQFKELGVPRYALVRKLFLPWSNQ